ncbi:MAG: hypothetical protein NT118_05280 [Lentisphaerae bacterium]|nr:hypothetical protein [Lentisphaerota bacterium]
MEVNRLIKFRDNGWEWHLKNPAILDSWFHSWKQIAKKNMVKSSRVRAVFKVEAGKAVYYVKYNYPISLTSKIHSSLIPKSKSEFDSSLLLEEQGVSVVEICGWGRRGTESMLITRELEDSVNARTFWFSDECANAHLKNAFLDRLSDFLRKFMSSGFYHPDFHIGNLMINKNDMNFALVDTHGIEKKKKLRYSQYFRMVRVIGALRGELTDMEAGELILKSRLAKDFVAADALWYRILEAEAAEIEKLWKKREKQIMAGTGKYCRVFRTAEGHGISIRNSVAGQSLVDSRAYLQGKLEEVYEQVKLNGAEAGKLWLASFRLQFHRIPHRMPIAWIRKDQSRSVLLYRKNNPGYIRKTEEVGEFLKRCRTAGIKHDISSKLSEYRGGVLISELNNLTFQ